MNFSKLSRVQIEEQPSRVIDSKKPQAPFGSNFRNISITRIDDNVSKLKAISIQDKRIVDARNKPAAKHNHAPKSLVQSMVEDLQAKITDSAIKGLLTSSRNFRRQVLENLQPSLRRRVLDSLKEAKALMDAEDLEANLLPDPSLSMSASDIADYLTTGNEEFISKIDLMPQPLQALCTDLVSSDKDTEERSMILHKISDFFKDKNIKFVADSAIEDFLESSNLGDGEEVQEQSPIEIFGNALLDLSTNGDMEAFIETLTETGMLGEETNTASEDDIVIEDISEEEAENIPEEDLSNEDNTPTLDCLKLTKFCIKHNKVVDSLKSFLMKRNVIIDSSMDTLTCSDAQYTCPPMTCEEYHTAVLLPKIKLIAKVLAARGSCGSYDLWDSNPVSIEYDGNFVYVHNRLGGVRAYVPVAPIEEPISLQNQSDWMQSLVAFEAVRDTALAIGEEDIYDFTVYKKNPFRGEWVR